MYTILEEIGSGSQGSVYKVCNKKGELFSMKKFHKKHVGFHEFLLMNELKECENIPIVYDYNDKENYIIMEYIPYGTLYSYLHNVTCFSEEQARSIFHSIVYAVKYMHNKGYVHRDLKLENVMLQKPKQITKLSVSYYTIKLIDFGLTVNVKNAMHEYYTIGTFPYIAPEIQKQKGGGFISDVWSLGILLYELIYGKVPFHSKQLFEQNVYFPNVPKISSSLKHLIQMMLLHDPNKRICVNGILYHPWVRNEKVSKRKLWNKRNVFATLKQNLICQTERLVYLNNHAQQFSTS